MKPAMIILIALTGMSAGGSLPWPTGPGGTQTQTRTLMNSYGSPNKTWLEVYNAYCDQEAVLNFHAGIDIVRFDESEPGYSNVYAIESGYYIDIPGDSPIEMRDGRFVDEVWYTIGSSPQSEEGWCYQHLTFIIHQLHSSVSVLDQISTMHPDVETVHTHLMWADKFYEHMNGCDFNPLDELSFASGYNWNWREDRYAIQLTEQKTIAEWAALQGGYSSILVPHDDVSGPVDILFEYYFEGLGTVPGQTEPSTQPSITPERIEWFVSRETVSGPEEVFRRFLVNFDMEDLGTEDHMLPYMLFYFRWFRPSPEPFGVRNCISNCGDASSWTNLGLSNIEENCWQTDGYINSQGLAGSTTNNPILQETPDGEYSITVISHAYNSMESDSYTEEGILLCNSKPVLREVSMLDLATDQVYYHAVWEPSTSGTSAELNVTVDQPVAAGTPVQVILVFTETMDTKFSLRISLDPTPWVLEPGAVQWLPTTLGLVR